MDENERVQELDDYLYKVTTRKGEFWVELARRNVEEAELQIWKTFIQMNLPYQRLELRKNILGTREQHIYIDPTGVVMAGELVWKATGRTVEFEATKIAMDAEFAAEREEYEQRRGN